MLKMKTSLLAATMIAGAVAAPAYAQVTLPAPSSDGDAALHGAGGSGILRERGGDRVRKLRRHGCRAEFRQHRFPAINLAGRQHKHP